MMIGHFADQTLKDGWGRSLGQSIWRDEGLTGPLFQWVRRDSSFPRGNSGTNEPMSLA